MESKPQSSRSESMLDQYQALLEMSEAIAAHRDPAALFRDLAELLRRVIQFDFIFVALHDPIANCMRLPLVEITIPLKAALPDELPIETTPAGWVWRNQQPLLISDVTQETRFPLEMVRLHGIKSFYTFPLTSASRRLGALGIGSLTELAYREADQEFLQQVTNQVAVAVDNALNFQQATAAQEQLTRERDLSRLLLEVNNAVVSRLDLQELLAAISACFRRVLSSDFAGIALYDLDVGQLRVHALDYEQNQELFGTTDLIPLEGTAPGKAFTTRKTVLLRRFKQTESSLEIVRRAIAVGFKSGCHVPLISHDQALGTLDVLSFREDAFSEADAELLTQIGQQIAIAVENALNFESARAAQQQFARERDRTQLMLEINNAVVSYLSLRDLVRATSSCLREVLRHDVTGISLYEPETNQFRAYLFDVQGDLPVIEEGTPLPVEGTVGGLAFTSGQPVFINRIDAETATTDLDRRYYEAGMRSGGCVPLVSHGRKLGVLGVASYREDAFSEADQELLVHIANQIAIAVENSLAYREIETLKNKLNEEKLYLEDEIRSERNFEEIIGASPTLKRILKQVETVAPTDSAVLIRGETGTGKELVARAIHSLSERRERTLVKLNCAAIPTGLLESELFGHEKGAFTGAIAQRIGRFELAHKGTLFLDEVGDIPLELQPKLLRVLQEQEFERLGSARTQRVDVRMVAATNCDLEQMVAGKQFRGDLFYRLNVFPITIPPLRERREDIPLLVRAFAQRFAHRMKKSIDRIPTEAMTALTQYHWPGNVRELENLIERAVILSPGPELEISITELKPAASSPAEKSSALTLEAAEREHILRVLRETDWVVSGPAGAAARLGMNRSTLQSRMRKLGIARPK